MESMRDGQLGFYRRYLARCNDHRFDELGEFVAPHVSVGDTRQGLDDYVAGLRAVVEAFPDFHWELQELLVDGNRLAARLTDTGTHTGTFEGVAPTGATVTATELAIYRLEHGRIVECWGDLGATLRYQLTGGAPG